MVVNKTVELVNAWARYEAKYPGGDVADFCRYYLAHQDVKEVKGTLVGGVVPNITDSLLLKIMGRISKLNMQYASKALSGTGLGQIEEFGILVHIKQNVNPRKTDVIYASLLELSSGSDMLKRLQKRGFVREYVDEDDRRSKRLALTAKGETAVDQCHQRIVQNARMLLHDLDDADKKLCIQILKGVEVKFSRLWPEHKGKPFPEVYTSIVNSAT
ncbi:MarR family winged helix-turn-helix transcriptional regulator [Dawidia soli]|uniref:Winged helix DNA-binding protein n=1 Tax=Dawidia soli TaxID=2782352 RepID=A0AAP2GFC4_9BACT|nr:winged helix DNA-binding protein [Dawidia soli]MBT1684981.1 winged helix DNA-binding protein [Dawidia soli]